MNFLSETLKYDHIPKKWIIRLIAPILKEANGQQFAHDSDIICLALNKNHIQ